MSMEKAQETFRKRVEDAAKQFHFETGQHITDINVAAKDPLEESLQVADIRNKLSPIVHMVAMVERGHYSWIEINRVKNSINYLAQRDVFKDIPQFPEED